MKPSGRTVGLSREIRLLPEVSGDLQDGSRCEQPAAVGGIRMFMCACVDVVAQGVTIRVARLTTTQAKDGNRSKKTAAGVARPSISFLYTEHSEAYKVPG